MAEKPVPRAVIVMLALLLAISVMATLAMVRDLAFMRGFLAGEASCMEVDRD